MTGAGARQNRLSAQKFDATAPGAIIAAMKRRWAVMLMATATAHQIFEQAASTSDPFGPLRFFAGSWRGAQSGQPGDGTSERTYEFVLSDRFLQVRNTSTYPPQQKNNAERSTTIWG